MIIYRPKQLEMKEMLEKKNGGKSSGTKKKRKRMRPPSHLPGVMELSEIEKELVAIAEDEEKRRQKSNHEEISPLGKQHECCAERYLAN